MQNQDFSPQDRMDSVGNAQFVNGTPVFDVNGDKAGDVSQYERGQGYFVMTKGLFFPKDIYVPLSAITRATTDGVYLNLTKDQIKNQNWENPPTATGTNAMYAPDTAPTDTRQTAQSGQRVDVPVAEEQLTASKQRQQVGDVKVHKDVVEQPESIDVPVSHEEVNVRRVQTNDQAAGDIPDDAFQERTIDVPVMGETVDVEKQARKAGAVEIDKNRVTQDKRYTDTVRREKVDVSGPDDQQQQFQPDDLAQDQSQLAADDQDVTPRR